jgi:hypothetical protein
MEPQSSVPNLEEPAIGPYPKPDESSSQFPTLYP